MDDDTCAPRRPSTSATHRVTLKLSLFVSRARFDDGVASIPIMILEFGNLDMMRLALLQQPLDTCAAQVLYGL